MTPGIATERAIRDADPLEQTVAWLELQIQDEPPRPGRRLCEFCGRNGWKNYVPFSTTLHGAALSWMCSSERECARRLKGQLARLWLDNRPGRIELAEAVHRAMWRAGAREQHNRKIVPPKG